MATVAGSTDRMCDRLSAEQRMLVELATKYFQDIPSLVECENELAELRQLNRQIEDLQETKRKVEGERKIFTQEFRTQAATDYGVVVGDATIKGHLTPGKRQPTANLFRGAEASPFLPPSLSKMGSGQKRRQKPINMPHVQFADENVKPRVVVEKKIPLVPTRCKEIRLVSTEEFTLVPKYMKGSLTADRLNAVVQKLNEAISHKYDLIGQAEQKGGQRGMGRVEKDRLVAYREQENLDTRGFAFICESDFKALMNPREMLGLKQLLPILRHCGRLKEVRGQNLLRYVILPH